MKSVTARASRASCCRNNPRLSPLGLYISALRFGRPDLACVTSNREPPGSTRDAPSIAGPVSRFIAAELYPIEDAELHPQVAGRSCDAKESRFAQLKIFNGLKILQLGNRRENTSRNHSVALKLSSNTPPLAD